VSQVLPIAGGRLAIVDGTGLFWHDDAEREGRLLDEPACEVSAADGPGSSGGRFLAYFSPCEERQLVVFDLDQGVRIEVGPSVEARAVVHAGDGVPIVFSVAPLEGDGSQAGLWVQRGSRRDLLGKGTLAAVGRQATEGVWVWLSDGERGPLVRWSEEGVETVHSEVIGFDTSHPQRALVEQEGETSLIALEGFAKPTVVASPASGTGRSGPRASIFFEEERDGTATLRLWEHGTTRVESVGERVRVASANFWFTGETLIYEEEWDLDAEEGRLCLRVMENGDTFCEPAVSSFRVMNRPERGIALVERTGANHRLFWAAIQ
jgi:hypothetical protein